MTSDYFTPQEVAERLNVSRQTVYRWIHDGKLESTKFGSARRISKVILERFEASAKQQDSPPDDVISDSQDVVKEKATWGASAMTRREFLRGTAEEITGGAALLITATLLNNLNIYLRNLARIDSGAQEAQQLLRQLLGRIGSTSSYYLGRETYSAGYHPDNSAAGTALVHALQLVDTEPIVIPAGLEIETAPEGDLIVVGGPNSNPLTGIAWELEGPNNREVRRRPDPLIPLPYYQISDEKDPSVAQDVRIAWKMQGVGYVSTVNWHLVDTRTGERQRVREQQNQRITFDDGDAFLPSDNFLLITKIPNFLSQDFIGQIDLAPIVWPSLLVFDGTHGLGTRAAELLVSNAGLEALKSAESEIGMPNSFQLLFRVTDLRLTWNGAYHKFHSIELMDAISLDYIDRETYRKAHKYARNRMWRYSRLPID